MSSLYYLGLGIISLGTSIYNFDVYSSGKDIKCFKNQIFNQQQYDEFIKITTNYGCTNKNVDNDIKYECRIEDSNIYISFIFLIAFIYLIIFILSIFLSFTINALSNQTPEDFIQMGIFKKIFACLCKIFPPILIILSWLNFIFIIVLWILIGISKCNDCQSKNPKNPVSTTYYYNKVISLMITNSIIWVVVHLGGSVIRAMTYVEPFMYDPEIGNPHFCKVLFFKRLGP